jgi:hypothetical protein
LLLGANPLSRADIAANDATISIWWAGIALAVVNLIPILPLDGGSILGIFVEWLSPTRGRSAMLWFSVAVSSIGVACAIVMPVLQGFLPFAAVLLVLQVQMLRAERSVEGMRARLTPLAFIAALQDAGAHEAAAGEAAKLFRSTPSAELAARVSISLSASGDHDGAQAWMRLAEQMTLVRRD